MVSDQTQLRSKSSLIRLIRLWSDHSYPEVTSDDTIYRPKWPLIIPSPDWSDLWSNHPQTELTSDHTIPRQKRPLIKPSPDRSDLWSYYCALEPNPRPCNFGLGTHRVRWTWYDQRSLPVGTSTWAISIFYKTRGARGYYGYYWSHDGLLYNPNGCRLYGTLCFLLFLSDRSMSLRSQNKMVVSVIRP